MAYPRRATRRGRTGAPVLVLLSSLGTPAALWDLVARELEDRWDLVLIEHPGHAVGAGPLPVAASLDTYADEVVATLEGLGVERAHIAGVSIGGALALTVATRHPDRVLTLSAIGTPARFGTPPVWLERAALVRASGTASLAAGLLERWVPPAWAAAHPSEAAQLEAWVASTDDEAYARHCEALAAWELTEPARISHPTLLITGSDDPVAPPGEIIALATALPRAVALVLAHSRHLPLLDRPHTLASVLDAHLDGRLED